MLAAANLILNPEFDSGTANWSLGNWGGAASTLDAKTVPVAIAEFIGRYVVNVNGMMAGGILAALPPVILALIFQRYIVSGLSAGAVKS